MKKIPLGVCLCFNILLLSAQENEIKSWNAVEYKMDISKKWSIDFSQHYRLKEDLSVVDNIITQTEVYFKPAKRWKLAAQFRYNYRNDTKGGIQGFENMLRYRFGLEKKVKVKPGNLEFRVMYQDRFSLDRENRSKKVIRYRPSFEWKIKNWSYDPKFYFEYLDEQGGDEQKSFRYGLGTKVKLKKTQALAIRYFYQRSTETFRANRSAHVLSLKYVLSQKKKKVEKKKKKPEAPKLDV